MRAFVSILTSWYIEFMSFFWPFVYISPPSAFCHGWFIDWLAGRTSGQNSLSAAYSVNPIPAFWDKNLGPGKKNAVIVIIKQSYKIKKKGHYACFCRPDLEFANPTAIMVDLPSGCKHQERTHTSLCDRALQKQSRPLICVNFTNCSLA